MVEWVDVHRTAIIRFIVAGCRVKSSPDRRWKGIDWDPRIWGVVVVTSFRLERGRDRDETGERRIGNRLDNALLMGIDGIFSPTPGYGAK